MNATAFTAPGEGATAGELYVVLAADKRYRAIRHALGMLREIYPPTTRTNLVLLNDRPEGLTEEDLQRIAEVLV